MNFTHCGQVQAKPTALFATVLMLSAAFGGLALALVQIVAAESIGALLKNQLEPQLRALFLVSVLSCATLGALLGAWAVLFRSPVFGVQLAKKLSPLGAFAVVPLLAQERIFRGHDLLFLVAVWLSGALVISTFYASQSQGEGTVFRALSRRIGAVRLQRICLGTAVLGAIGYGVYFSKVTVASHYNFCTSAFDLGIEDNLVWNAAHGGPLFRSAPLGGSMLHGGNHQTYFAYVLVPLYLLAPRAETLLIFQSVVLGAASIPLYLYASRLLGPFLALIISVGYLFYAPLHGANLYDFHYQPLGIFFTFTIAYLLLTRSRILLGISVLLMLSVREDMGAMMAAISGYSLLKGRRPALALGLMLLGTAYFVAFKLWIMPQFFMSGESSFTFMYRLLIPANEKGFGGVLKTVLTNPVFVLDSILTKEKLIYVLQIFVPVALLALKRSPALILFAPACTFTLLSTDYRALIMTSFQYTSYWTPMVFIALVEVLGGSRHATPRLARAERWSRAAGVVLTLLLTSNRYGAIFQTETARGAFDPVRLTITDEDRKNHADFEALVAQIPKDAKLVAAEWLVSHVSNRRDAYTLRFGLRDAEYLLFWTHKEKLRADEKPPLRKALFGKHAEFGVVERRGMFILAKRGYSRAKNSSVRSLL